MIDIQEPVTPVYSFEEKENIKQKFILLLHTLLIVYLSIHNLLLPLLMNIIKNKPLMLDVHWWFLLQIPVQWFLRKGKVIPKGYLLFLIIGSILRLTLEVYTADNLKSWFILSVFISEISSGIFYAVYFPLARKNAMMPLALLAFALIPTLKYFEHKTEAAISFKTKKVEHVQSDSASLGCLGSNSQLDFPLKSKYKLLNSVAIADCGFTEKIISPSLDFTIVNTTSQILNLRLYKLQVLYGRVKWKFLRLIQVKSSELWSPNKLISTDTIYLIKIPENRKLGHLVLVPIGFEKFPIGKGSLHLDYDSLNWTPLP